MPRTPIDTDTAEVIDEATATPDSTSGPDETANLAAVIADESPALTGDAPPPEPPPTPPADIALLEALLAELTQTQDPWAFVNGIAEREVPMEHRHHFYANFTALVAMRPQAEQDALIQRGQQVFRYRAETARRDVDQLRETGASATKIAVSVVCDEFMAESIYVPGASTPIRYMMYRFADGSTEIVDRVQVGETIYLPPQTRLVETGTVLLPTGVEEYEDFPSLFREVRHAINSHVHIEDTTFRNIMADYVFMSWIFDRFDVVPYLRSQGEYGTGKTRVLQVMGSLCFRAIMAGGATTAAPIFRLIERFRGTLVIDEADFGDSDMWAEIVKIFNVGYMRGFPVLRAERDRNDAFDVKSYDCYGPKLLSTRRRFKDQALESRCLSYTMPMLTVPTNVPLVLGDEFRALAQSLRNKMLLWRFRNYRHAFVNPTERIAGLDARLNQILLPLIACTGEDQHMREAIVRHATHYQTSLREDRRESYEGKVAHALLQRYAKRKRPDRFPVKEIIDQLKMEYGENFKIETRVVGEIIRHTFGLATDYRGGSTWAIMTDGDADRLARRYAIPDESWRLLATQTATALATQHANGASS